MTDQRQPQVAEGGRTRKRKMLGLILVFVGIGVYFPGFLIFTVLGDYLTKETVTWLVKVLLPLVWALPIIGLGLHARTHERTFLWAATGWFPVFGPLLGLLAMHIDVCLARWKTPKIIRGVCAGLLIVGIPLMVLGMALPGFRAYNNADNIRQGSAATSSTNIIRER